MSTTTLPFDARVGVLDAVAACTAAIGRAPSGVRCDGATLSLDYTPDLTAQETTTVTTTVADLVQMAKFGVTCTLAEWQAIKPDAALLKTFAGIASPTLAQTAAATKAQSRILAVIFRS